MKPSLFAASCLLLYLMVAIPAKATQRQVPQSVIDWLRPRSTSLGASGSTPDPAQAQALDDVLGSARVVAFGEITHFMHEPLAYRNWLIRFLIQQRGLTAVAIESGQAQGRRVNDYVLGGTGEEQQIVHDNLSWGFGELAANVELIHWLRAYNAEASHARVRFYGFDLSGGDGKDSFSGAVLALTDLIGYFTTAAPTSSARLRAALATFSTRFTPEAFAGYTAAERSRLNASLDQSLWLLTSRRVALIAASSPDAYGWAVRAALDCRHLLGVFTLWPKDDPRRSADALRKMFAVSSIRDAAMANNVIWALHREGPRGRLLVFAAAGHVAATNLVNDQWLVKTVTMQNMGQHLRAQLGTDYRILVTAAAEAEKPDAQSELGSINRAIAAIGSPPPLLVNLRDPPAQGWWQVPQSIGQSGNLLRAIPSRAFDGVLFVSQVTPEPHDPLH